jgi:hypothetical protein
MITASIDNQKTWKTTDRPLSLEIALTRRTFILPWTQFLFAEGHGEEIRLAFATHDIVLHGSGMGALLEDLSAQRVSLLREPVRAERFVIDRGPSHNIDFSQQSGVARSHVDATKRSHE